MTSWEQCEDDEEGLRLFISNKISNGFEAFSNLFWSVPVIIGAH